MIAAEAENFFEFDCSRSRRWPFQKLRGEMLSNVESKALFADFGLQILNNTVVTN